MSSQYEFEFGVDKNLFLKKACGISFEELILLINEGCLLDIVDHPNKKKYPGQKIYVVNVNDYVYLMPFVRKKNKIFLKTIYPSRKATKDYILAKETK